MWLTILGWVFPLLKDLLAAYNTHVAAGVTSKQIAADLAGKEIAAQQADVAAAADIVKAEQDKWYTACIRPLMAMPFVVFTWKVVIYDKVLHLGTTPALDPNLWNIFMSIVVAYFGGRSIEKVARILKS